jgi:diguanylate cyclase (GGDEF)-like protein/PAS domain S-box-containing protein
MPKNCRWQRSLKEKITLGILAIFILGIWALSYYVTGMLRDDMKSLLANQQASTVSYVASELNQALVDRIQALEKTARSIDQSMLNNPSATQDLLEKQPVFLDLFNSGVVAVKLDGTAIADAPVVANRKGTNYASNEATRLTLSEGRTVIGRPVVGKVLHQALFNINAPIRSADGKVIGALFGVINLAKPSFLDRIGEHRYGKSGGYLVVAPQYNLFVTATDKSRVMQSLPPPGNNAMVDKRMMGFEGPEVAVNSLGVEILSSAKRIPVAGWFVIATLPTEEAFAPIRDLQQRILAASIVLTLFAGMLSWWLLHSQLSPLTIAARRLTEMSTSGKSFQPIPVARQDEIGQLIEGFNELLKIIGQREAQVQNERDFFSTLWKQSSDGVLLFRTDDLSIQDANSSLCKILGYERDELCTMKLDELVQAPSDTIRKNVRQIVQNKTYLVGERRYRKKDGLQLDIEVNASLVETGGAQLIMANLRDITERKRAEKMAEQYHSVIMASLDGFWITDFQGRILDANESVCRVLGYSREELLRLSIRDIEADESPAEIAARTRSMMETGHVQFEARHRRKDGTIINVEVSVLYVATIGDHFFAFIRDVTQRKHAEAALRIAATAFESQEGMFITDAKSVIVQVNRAFSEITGYTARDAIGQTPKILSSGRHDAAFYDAMKDSIGKTGGWQGEIWNRRKNGEVYPEWLTITAVKSAQGEITHYVSTLTDITSRKTAEDEIKNLAFYDPLTRLPNRRLLLDRLKQALASSTRNKRYGALLFVDLDNFKTLNDTLGHYIGDLLLQQVALRLATCVREGDTVARLGGDEFVVMLEDLSENSKEAATQAETVGEKILLTLNQSYQLATREHRNTPSIGVTLFSDHQETIDELLKRADLAMYQAKAAGRNTLRFFDPEMQAAVITRAALEADLREAVLKNQFLLYYQAQVNDDSRVTGVEVLLRWKHPSRGLVSPLEFIALAEDTGLILPLGRWVLETACSQLALWAARSNMDHLTIAVNVSARQFKLPNFVEGVLEVLDQTGANPQRLKLELTESLLVDDMEDIIAKMSALKDKGVNFSLDDFGTGYSSLSYLKRLPLDQLKIDQGFVRDMLTDSNDAAIAKMVIALAKSMGLAVIAEGVEIEAQREILALHGCHAYQGYLFSRPLPIDGFEDFMKPVNQ